MTGGKDHDRVELTFHKNLPTLTVYKRRAKSRRQPAPSAARRPPPTTRSTPTASREPTAPEKETSPPALQTLELNTPDTRHHHSYKTTKDSTRHLHTSRNQLHRLLLQRLHVPRDREQCRRSTRPNSRHSISTST